MKLYKSAPPNKISDFAKEFNFELLRPYYDNESDEVMKRIAQYDSYHKAMAYLWPEMSKEEVVEKALNTKSPYEFQTGYMSEAIWKIVNSTSAGLTWSGLEHLDSNKAYLYIANHRDILLDSAILQIILDKEEFETSEITFGSNLMDQGFITDFGRMNRMFTVKREGNVKELYDISRQLSAYIRHVILDKNTSVWIAQRNGRTKDGNDMTQTGLLKMLNLSGDADFKKSFSELNIVPLTISFEYEPCDHLKVQELYLSSLHTKYVKAPGEDLNSILTGIKQPKGKIYVAFGKPITANDLVEIDKSINENEKIKLLASHIDKCIYQSYKLNPINYVAYDVLNKTNVFESNYTSVEKQSFLNYIDTKIKDMTGEADVLKNLFLTLYANPVINKLK
ncbi:MAG: 1-acyl-sn-glycerol-3-phosphate acyltransferase [Bacteroidetes bacterium]|jgi:glycerol-3-phosphate O-acyltransferase|nr:1-acyl-sn-glycerol-3-phosphate acyltransferase [Bacteroidota bacterium]